MSTHPLELPEILISIGYFLPLWKRTWEDSNYFTFKPKTLISCLLVCKLWHQTLLPILWHTYSRSGADNIPNRVIIQNSPFFNALYWSLSAHQGPFHCRHLSTLSIEGPYFRDNLYGESTLQRDIHRQLVRANPGLRTLMWCGPNPRTTLETDDFSRLRSLKHLRLAQWDATGGRLEKVLKAFAETLETLELDRILSDTILPGDQQDQDDNSPSEHPTDTDINQHGRDQLILPFVTRLGLFDSLKSGRDLQEAGFLCPNMEQISLHVDKATSPRLKEGLEYLRAQCPNIRSLHLKNCTPRDRLSIKIIESCSLTGLTRLELSGSKATDQIVAAIMAQARTLERLKITTESDELAVKNVLLLLTGLSRLKELRLYVRINVRSLEEVETWGSVPWVKDLEVLSFWFMTDRMEDIHFHGDDNDDSDNDRYRDNDENSNGKGGVDRVLQKGEEAVVDKVFEQVERMKCLHSLTFRVNGVRYFRRPSK
ncbi:hypothetical protein K457DRAFT_121535 [Linnemannia elongata AG-77]|uniref:F-box domain-containing protein n=1 Tax=Linnemannia elongata AG-77 TaxID=1314771 RepID=A0A197KD74_9FUNG|nr:hypothetical protein K457DRAFT_121535 [Linnemannia elongata AG-77]